MADVPSEAERMAAAFAKVTRRKAFANARRMMAVRYRRLPNWSVAMELYGLGSTYAWAICEEMGIDPDATTASPWPDPPDQPPFHADTARSQP